MRAALDRALASVAAQNKNIMVVVGDVSPIALGTFTKDFSDRFVNIGIAEANMVSFGAGLALSGKIPFLFTIATFMTFRCYEQIRDDVCFQNLNVKIIGGGGGFVYSTLGATHHATEDYAVMRVLPHMVVLAPVDPFETEHAVSAMARHVGPAYLRLGRSGDTDIYTEEQRKKYKFEIGKAITLRSGKDIALISASSILKNVLSAADKLSVSGIEAEVINMHTIKPIDREAVLQAAKKCKAIITVEEHQRIGGLGSAVAEILAEEKAEVNFRSMGIRDMFLNNLYGSRDYLLEKAGLGVDDIIKAVKSIV